MVVMNRYSGMDVIFEDETSVEVRRSILTPVVLLLRT